MTNSKELFTKLVNRVTVPYSRAEIQSIIYLLFEKKLGLSRTDILVGKKLEVSSDEFDSFILRINQYEPIQYILGEALFYRRVFKVNSSVLIPRPETELLVDEICRFAHNEIQPKTLLDIGTGSGCIAISLALELPETMVKAIDISESALACAAENAACLKAQVTFSKIDILKDTVPGSYDLIVSNPPYISDAERGTMNKNVLDFEPHKALFAPGSDPMIFYKVIGEKARKLLSSDGSLWFEINEHYGTELKKLMEVLGYQQVQIIKDLDKKDRILRARS